MQDILAVATEQLPLVPLRGLLAYPHMMLKIDVGRERSVGAVEQALATNERMVIVTQRDQEQNNPSLPDVYDVGTEVVIRQALEMPDDTLRLVVEGKRRVRVLDIVDASDMLLGVVCDVEPILDVDESTLSALIRDVKDLFECYAREREGFPPEFLQVIAQEEDPDQLCDLVAANTLSILKDRQYILGEDISSRRLMALRRSLAREMGEDTMEQDMQGHVQRQMELQQKEYYLQEQLSLIHEELGADEQNELELMRRRLAMTPMNQEARLQVEREVRRLGSMPSGTPESAVSRGYIEYMLELPWGRSTRDNMDVAQARRVLNKDHYGLEEVKERILEFLAVGAMKGNLRGPILCLVGPPGVGKTSIAKSVAEALERKFVRMSLGGLRDEAEIRGHRRTYVGAIPGRLISSIRKCGSLNPVFLLDEIDKMASDFRGDPASALLEALDPEQNATFADHYLEAPFDLSQVLFLTTANQVSSIPGPLLDRMELIEVEGYTYDEKMEICLRHLWPKQLELHGLEKRQVRLSRKAVQAIIEGYTREAGVRQLEQRLTKLCRRSCVKLSEGQQPPLTITEKNLVQYLGPRKYLPDDMAVQPQLGAVNGLAWTAYGGDALAIEAAAMPGKGEVELTGQLGDVMKESAQAAHSYLRMQAPQLRLQEDFFKTHDLHIHVPEGATPKDGPSAGVALYCALASAATGRLARQDVAMTGEITLLGRVLPVGGIKEKLLAAHRMGIRQVLLPRANQRDLEKLPQDVRAQLNITLLDRADQALALVLEPAEGGTP